MNAALNTLLRRAQDRLEFAAKVHQLDAEPNVLIARLSDAVQQACQAEIARQRERDMALAMFDDLPEGQRDAVILAAKGYIDKEIATAMGISNESARTRRCNGMSNLGVETPQMLAVLAYKAGLICNHDD